MLVIPLMLKVARSKSSVAVWLPKLSPTVPAVKAAIEAETFEKPGKANPPAFT